MYFQKKEPIHNNVDIEEADPQSQLLLEQFEGATEELSAALQYWMQSSHCEDNSIKDMLQDISIKQSAYLEIVGKLIEQYIESIVLDLQANLAAQPQGHQTYESLNQTAIDFGNEDILLHLLFRKSSDAKMFMKALNNELNDPLFSNIQLNETGDMYAKFATNSYDDNYLLEVGECEVCNIEPEFSCFAYPVASKS